MNSPLVRFALPTCVISLILVSLAGSAAAEITGDYLEARTCDIYTGPCFANAETGLTGNSALMAWSIDEGEYQGVELSGLKVVAAMRTNCTLGNFAVSRPDLLRVVILVDERASATQHDALAAFARERFHGTKLDVVRVESAKIEMSVDHVEMVGRLKAGDAAEIVTRNVRKGDCVCSNEIIFYPPLSQVDNFAPAVVVTGGYQGSGLNGRWESVNTRSAFLATFDY